MKRKVSVIVLLALTALLCACGETSPADTEVKSETSVSEPADCCGGEIPDCCKEKEESQADCCKENEESKADCCEEKEESDCCKEESKADCCKHNES